MRTRPKENVYLFCAIFLLLISVFYIYNTTHVFQKEHTFSVPAPLVRERSIQSSDAFSVEQLVAQAAFVSHAQTNEVLYTKNADIVLPLASLTKLATAMSAREILKPDTPITISSRALAQPGDHGLIVGETWQAIDLIRFMLLTSSNDAAYALAEKAGTTLLQNGEQTASAHERFVQYMNSFARSLGLTKTHFSNVTGLDIQASGTEKNGGYSTAKEITHLFVHGVDTYPDIFSASSMSRQQFRTDSATHEVPNSNHDIAYGTVLASKTGYTDTAGGNLTVLFTKGLHDPYVVTVLHSSYTGRFSDVRYLANQLIY